MTHYKQRRLFAVRVEAFLLACGDIFHSMICKPEVPSPAIPMDSGV